MYTTFDGKPQFHLRDFVIEKTIRIPEKEFASMLGNPMEDKDFLMENKELMYQDFSGTYHCLLIVGEGRTDGILIQSDGYDYARFASYVPEAAVLSYPSLHEMNRKLAAAVDFIVSKGLWNTAEEIFSALWNQAFRNWNVMLFFIVPILSKDNRSIWTR